MAREPHVYDVIIIGLGVMGSATAYHAARSGARVLALEQFGLDHRLGSSYGESRIIRYAYSHPTYVEMAKHAFPMWQALEGAVGKRLMWRTGGFDFGSPDSPTLSETRHNLEAAGVPFEWLNAHEANERFPQFRLAEHMKALYQPDAGYLAASACVLAQAEMAERHGATLRLNTPVTRIEPLADSVRIHTDGGSYEAGRLILTAGSWTGKLLAALDLTLPLTPTREQLVFFDAPELHQFTPERFPIFIYHDTPWYYGLPNVDGNGVKVAIHCNGEATDPDGTRREVDAEYIEGIRAWTRTYLPRAEGRVSDTRVCLYTMTPDEHFIIDRHPAYPQIVIASPCSGHGFKFGILIGQILSVLALKGASAHDLSLFSLRRFADGFDGQSV